MASSNISKKIVTKVFIIISIIAVAIFVSSSQTQRLKDLNKRERTVKKEADNLKSRYNNFDSRKVEIEKAFHTWLELRELKEKFEGLNISNMKIILDDMKGKHAINRLDINMSKPTLLKGRYNADNVGVEASTIKLTINGYSDIQILFFIHDLLDSVPGYVDVSSLSLVRNYDLDERTYMKLSKDITFSPVSAELVFVWQELKSK